MSVWKAQYMVTFRCDPGNLSSVTSTDVTARPHFEHGVPLGRVLEAMVRVWLCTPKPRPQQRNARSAALRPDVLAAVSRGDCDIPEPRTHSRRATVSCETECDDGLMTPPSGRL